MISGGRSSRRGCWARRCDGPGLPAGIPGGAGPAGEGLCDHAIARWQVAGPLVGGAVVEIETTSDVITGDFDLLGGSEAVMADARVAVGFRHEARPGLKLGAFFHAELPIGIEFVSGGSIPLAAVEDPIADRMRQWEASDRRDQARFTQAALLLDLASEVDYAYLDHRIIEETAGAANLATQRGQTP